MTAFVTLDYWWINRELIREISIFELLFDAEFFCASFYVNFILLYSCINSQELKTQNVSQMCQNLSDKKSITEVIIKRSLTGLHAKFELKIYNGVARRVNTEK